MAQTTTGTPRYFVPPTARWPMLGTIGLMILVIGASNSFNGHSDAGAVLMAIGSAFTLAMIVGWFGTQIREHERGLYSKSIDTSYRMGMLWFILSEVMFFAAFFGALWYVRTFAVPWLGGEGSGAPTNIFLWPGFEQAWPTNGPAEVGGKFSTIPPFELPAINTAILLASGVCVTIAHHAVQKAERAKLLFWLGLTVVLGVIFLGLQITEYLHAYKDLNLTLASGIYGNTFFMLTGFHGLHVTLGAIILAVIWGRAAAGHFSSEDHFAFEAAAWYWHFVDVVWLGLFLFVYVL